MASEYYKANRERILEYLRRRRREDPEYAERLRAKKRRPETRAKANANRRNKRLTDAEWHDKQKAQKSAYWNQPANHERKIAQGRASYARHKDRIRAQFNKRYATDAEFRERILAHQRTPEYRAQAAEARRRKYLEDADYRERVLKPKRTPEYRAKYNEGRRNKVDQLKAKAAAYDELMEKLNAV